MKNGWLIYIVVALLASGAGVAIAGLPDSVSVDATVVPPTTTEPTSPPTTLTAETPDPSTPPTTTAAPTIPSSSSTVAPTTTQANNDGDLPPRSELSVVAANGANIVGAASRAADLLQSIGYVDAVPRDGTAVVDLTVVYFADGLEGAARRLTADWDLPSESVAPLEEAPTVVDLPPDTELLVYVGLDRP